MKSLAVLLLGVAFTLHAESPAELLARVDAQRYVPDLSFVLQMTSFDGDKQVESNTLWGFVKGVGTVNRSLVAFADPVSVKGRKMLLDGNIVYLLFPKTTNPIRLSPLQVLMLLLILEQPGVRVVFLLALSIWCFCRCYYFAFYVIEHYVDPGYRFSGLWSFIAYLWTKGGKTGTRQ